MFQNCFNRKPKYISIIFIIVLQSSNVSPLQCLWDHIHDRAYRPVDHVINNQDIEGVETRVVNNVIDDRVKVTVELPTVQKPDISDSLPDVENETASLFDSIPGIKRIKSSFGSIFKWAEGEKTADKPRDKPVDKPDEKLGDKSEEKPLDIPHEKPGEEPEERLREKPEEKPEEMAEKPGIYDSSKNYLQKNTKLFLHKLKEAFISYEFLQFALGLVLVCISAYYYMELKALKEEIKSLQEYASAYDKEFTDYPKKSEFSEEENEYSLTEVFNYLQEIANQTKALVSTKEDSDKYLNDEFLSVISKRISGDREMERNLELLSPSSLLNLAKMYYEMTESRNQYTRCCNKNMKVIVVVNREESSTETL